MSCVEKRHPSHRSGGMPHHRFPNGFAELLMDETDREVSTLTDRAFRSLCVGEDAAYNDDFSFCYSPFSCHKPLVEEPPRKTHHRESKTQQQSLNGTDETLMWKQQRQKNMNQVSSFLKALGATEGSCEGMLIRNGDTKDCNGESWDKTALRSIQRELSEFSTDYQHNLADGHFHQQDQHHHNPGDGLGKKTWKDVAPPSGKSSKIKNGKSTVKLRKLNIKNFFLHSEFSPFQAWRDFSRFTFGQEDLVSSTLPTDNIPKWYDSPFYKELAEAHRIETLHKDESQSYQQATVEPPPPLPKPVPTPPPPKVPPKPLAIPAEKRCTSEGGEENAAPWRRNRSRAKSVVPVNQCVLSAPPLKNSFQTVEENDAQIKKEARSIEVKAVEEVNSLASTPFSICQLMTPLIPSRQPTETSEILQAFLSPSAIYLPLSPESKAKLTPEPPVKRDAYKSLASSILFNLKDNRKRVKSRYSPAKLKTSELADNGKSTQADSEGTASGFSTPAILKDIQTSCSPNQEPVNTSTVGLKEYDAEVSASDDYLISNLLQTKREAAGSRSIENENHITPLIHSKKNKSPMVNKQNYPSLNLYKKAIPVDNAMNHHFAPLDCTDIDRNARNIDPSTKEENVFSPHTQSTELSSKAEINSMEHSPHLSKYVNNERLTDVASNNKGISPHVLVKEKFSPKVSVDNISPHVVDHSKIYVRGSKENNLNTEHVLSKEKELNGQPLSAMDVIRAAREAINATKHKALSVTQSEGLKMLISNRDAVNSKEEFHNNTAGSEMERNSICSPHSTQSTDSTASSVKREPPPVPKRNFAISDILLALDKQQTPSDDSPDKKDLSNAKHDSPKDSVQKQNDNEPLRTPGRRKHVFSARQNNYIKSQRHGVKEDEQQVEFEESEPEVNMSEVKHEGLMSPREIKDGEHIINDLQALKELRRASLGDHILENAKNKVGLINIEEETKAKNDLISRELRNIKKGMLSMRGNTLAKREFFFKKEQEQSKHEIFSKIDSNVVVNKALINDNYDKAKMALEEIITERLKNRCVNAKDENTFSEESNAEEGHTSAKQHKKATLDSSLETGDRQRGSISAQREMASRSGHLRSLLQTNAMLGEKHRSGNKVVLPGMDRDDGSDHLSPASILEQYNKKHIVRQLSEERVEHVFNENGDRRKGDVPAIPPRSKKGIISRDEISTKAKESVKTMTKEASTKDSKTNTAENHFVIEMESTESVKRQQDSHMVNTNITSPHVSELPVFPKHHTQSLLPNENRGNLNQTMIKDTSLSPSSEATAQYINPEQQEQRKVKRKAPLKPDNIIPPELSNQGKTINKYDTVTKNLVLEQKINSPSEEHMYLNKEAMTEIPKIIVSALENGVNQSPPDQGSMSSKSSYFSAESAFHRNTESDSNVYHSLENLTGELEEVDEDTVSLSETLKKDSEVEGAEFHSVSDHESETEVGKRLAKSPHRESKVPLKESSEHIDKVTSHSWTDNSSSLTQMVPFNTFSPTLEIPTLFKVKDNTFSNNSMQVQLWSQQENVICPDIVEELHHDVEIPMALKQTLSELSQFNPLSPPIIQSEHPKKSQFGALLTVPQEDENSGVSPSSEGTSIAEIAEEMLSSTAATVDVNEVLTVPSERSGSNCSGNDSQSGLPKPPVVLPKSEKALLKAMKLTNRRIQKEEAQNISSFKPSRSTSKHCADKHQSDSSEHKSLGSGRHADKPNRCSEKKSRERLEEGSHHRDRSEPQRCETRDHSRENQRNRPDHGGQTGRRSGDRVVRNGHHSEGLSQASKERQGRSNDRHMLDKPEQRHYSGDRVISNVPVYKTPFSKRPMSDRQFQRSQSIDRYVIDKAERRPSVTMSANDKPDPRIQQTEKTIMDELQQRGRAKGRAPREHTVKRSHSIDTYPSEISHHRCSLSRQSSHTSQICRQSSLEHTIVTQSFPMTQRKLLQDPDSGQYFFVDMPVQVKTKTFFDPETQSYVQLPVQPQEGTVPQASAVEVLNTPLVVYHGFVPVPLSSIQAPHMEQGDFQKRQLDRVRYNHEGRPYLEPVYGQHDHMLGESLGTEELDCVS